MHGRVADRVLVAVGGVLAVDRGVWVCAAELAHANGELDVVVARADHLFVGAAVGSPALTWGWTILRVVSIRQRLGSPRSRGDGPLSSAFR